MICTPAQGWIFSGWNGGLSGDDPRAIFYPIAISTEITATFVYTGALESTDDFESRNVGGWHRLERQLDSHPTSNTRIHCSTQRRWINHPHPFIADTQRDPVLLVGHGSNWQ